MITNVLEQSKIVNEITLGQSKIRQGLIDIMERSKQKSMYKEEDSDDDYDDNENSEMIREVKQRSKSQV